MIKQRGKINMIAKRLTLLFILTILAACNGRREAVAAPSVAADMWQTACLEKLSQGVELETSRLAQTLPRTESLDWAISIVLKARTAEVEITPDSQPTLRGGGGKYHLDCNSGELTLVEPYR
jgi:hypothetical protein